MHINASHPVSQVKWRQSVRCERVASACARRDAKGARVHAAHLLDNDADAAVGGLLQRSRHRLLAHVVRRLHAAEEALWRSAQRLAQRVRLRRAGERQADAPAALRAHALQRLDDVAVQKAALERRGVHLVEPHVRAQQRARLGRLPDRVRRRVLLDLVRRAARVDAPPRRVRVAPLGRHHHLAGRHAARSQPARQKVLREAVRPRNVKVPHARSPRRVQHALAARAQRSLANVPFQIATVAEVDVPFGATVWPTSQTTPARHATRAIHPAAACQPAGARRGRTMRRSRAGGRADGVGGWRQRHTCTCRSQHRARRRQAALA